MYSLFALKKLVSAFLLPLPIVVFLGLLGLILLWCTARHILGRLCLSVSFLILLLSITPFLPNFLIKQLEQTYPPLQQIPPHVSDIVVLGGGYWVDPKNPHHSQLGWSTVVRLVKGVQLYRVMKEQHPRLLLSGASYEHDLPSEADGMEAMAIQLGVDPQDIVLDRIGRDTEEEAIAIQTILGQRSFILVTSGYHMPRAMRIFVSHHLHPIAAPTDALSRPLHWGSLGIGSWFSVSARNLYMMDRAIHEYLGQVVSRATLRR